MSDGNPFESPLVRYGLGASSAVVVALIGYLVADGTTQLLFYVVAVLDFVVTTQVLERVSTA